MGRGISNADERVTRVAILIAHGAGRRRRSTNGKCVEGQTLLSGDAGNRANLYSPAPRGRIRHSALQHWYGYSIRPMAARKHPHAEGLIGRGEGDTYFLGSQSPDTHPHGLGDKTQLLRSNATYRNQFQCLFTAPGRPPVAGHRRLYTT